MKTDLTVFDEPLLEFANGQKVSHPRDGLTLFGPYDSLGLDKPKHISYGLVGTASGIDSFGVFAHAMQRQILSDEELSEVLWAHFPGFEEAFHTVFPATPVWAARLNEADVFRAANYNDSYDRVYGVVNLYLEQLKIAVQRDENFQVFICVVPDIVFKNCRPLSIVKDGIGQRMGKAQRSARIVMDDFFDQFDAEQYQFSIDFRRQLKARAMALGVPIQIIRESTLNLSPYGTTDRGLTPGSDRAWNLATGIYYKSGGKPWRLDSAREGVCYVGISFKNTEDKEKNACCAAQMFLDDGDGVVFMGDKGAWYSEKQGDYHLNRESAKNLLDGVLRTYREQNGKTLTEVFLHSKSEINEEEFAGYADACPVGVKLVGVRVGPERKGLRLFRHGTRPVLRGTFLAATDRRGFLWGSGFKSRLRTYDGSEVPVPLFIEVQHGDADIERVARDILALSKLNYNCCKLGESQPVTVHFSGAVGEILLSNPTVEFSRPNFKFYI